MERVQQAGFELLSLGLRDLGVGVGVDEDKDRLGNTNTQY